MNTRSSKEYRYIFTTMWKQASTSHLTSRLTDNASGKLLIIFILSYLFVLPTSFLRITKTHNPTSLQVWMQIYCTFVLFVNQHFPGLPASGTHCMCCEAIIQCKEVFWESSQWTRAVFPLSVRICHQQERTWCKGKRQLQMPVLAVLCSKLQSPLKANWSQGLWVKSPLIIQTNSGESSLLWRWHLTGESPGRGQAQQRGGNMTLQNS
jgi:hypothetical protein